MKTLGKIAGGVGLLLVLTSLITLLFTSGSSLVFFVKLGLGVASLGLWATTNGERLAGWARSIFYYSSSALLGLAFVALLVAANTLVAKRGKTWDLTAKQVYTLSAQTQAALAGLTDPVALIAFSEQSPSEQAEALFRRYQALSPKFAYEFQDPRRAPDLTARYQIRRGQPAAVLVRRGAHESHQVLNLTRLSSPQLGEQELTNGLLKLTAVGTQQLYFLTGHGEWPLEPPPQAGEEAEAESALQLKRALEDEGYAPSPLNLIERGEVPKDASAVALAGPRSPVSEPEVRLLARFLDEGGRLLLFTEPGVDTGLDALLARYGFQLEPGFIADTKVNPEQPYIVVTPFLGEHEITRPLAKSKVNLIFPSARAITLLREGQEPSVTTTALVLTSPTAWIETTPTREPEPNTGERQGQLTMAAAATRNTAGAATKRTDEARVVLFGDAELLTGAFGHDANRNLVMNAFAWATQQGQKITIRPPDRDVSTIDLPPETMATIRLLTMDLFPTLLIAVGLTIWLTRRSR